MSSNTKPWSTLSAADRADLRRACGSDRDEWNVELASRVVAAAWPVRSKPKGASTQASTVRVEDAPEALAVLEFSKTALRALKPANEVDGMIAGQAVALNHAAMHCLKLAMEPEQTLEKSSALRRDAAHLSRAMIEAVEALDRRRASAPLPPPAPQTDAAAEPAWRAPPMYPPTIPRVTDPDLTSENVISRTGPGQGYRGDPYCGVEPS